MSLPPVTQRQPRNFYTTKLTGKENARLLDGPVLHGASPFADILLLQPQFFNDLPASIVQHQRDFFPILSRPGGYKVAIWSLYGYGTKQGLPSLAESTRDGETDTPWQRCQGVSVPILFRDHIWLQRNNDWI